MGAKYGETRLVSPTAEVVCLGLAAVLGGVALIPGVRWATTQSRFRCDLGHLRDTVDYAYAVSFFEHDVRRIRSGGFDGWRPWNGDPCGRSAVLVESGGPGAATRSDARACLRAEGPFLFSDSEFDEASPPCATFHSARSASVAGAGLAVVGLWLLMLGALSADRSPKKAVLSGSVALACGAGSFAQAASVALFYSAPLVALGETKVGPGPFLSVAAATLSCLVAASRGVGLARARAPPAPPRGVSSCAPERKPRWNASSPTGTGPPRGMWDASPAPPSSAGIVAAGMCASSASYASPSSSTRTLSAEPALSAGRSAR